MTKNQVVNSRPISMPPSLKTIQLFQKDIIVVGNDMVEYVAEDVLSNIVPNLDHYVVVCDTTIFELHLPKFLRALSRVLNSKASASSATLLHVAIESGEVAKTRAVKERIEDFLLDNGCGRGTCLIALGGGVVGDLCGFVASTFMRGVPFIQVPTTLLAMVDASVGGKTAVDTPHGKNLIGTFWQPSKVYIDVSYLATLSRRLMSNGVAEIVKTGAIWDESLFSLMESSSQLLLNGSLADNCALLVDVIVRTVEIKARVVEMDEREGGIRAILNFGHSVGHAVETLLSPQILHGEAVAVGMVKEAEISRSLGFCTQTTVARLVSCLKAFSLPTSLQDALKLAGSSVDLSNVRLMQVMRTDKKNQGGKKRLILLSEVGKVVGTGASVVEDRVIFASLSDRIHVSPHKSVDSTVGRSHAEPVTITVPGSKSISNRVLILAALGRGSVVIRGLLHSDDTQVMMAALKKLRGCEFSWLDGGEVVVVRGGGGILHATDQKIYLGNAGTAARFLTSVVNLVSVPVKSTDPTSTVDFGV